jgi:hypothetical protein
MGISVLAVRVVWFLLGQTPERLAGDVGMCVVLNSKCDAV